MNTEQTNTTGQNNLQNSVQSDLQSSLQKSTMQAWQTALTTALATNELGTDKLGDSQLNDNELNKRAMFALIVVIKNQPSQASTLTSKNCCTAMQDWLDSQANTPAGWTAVAVNEPADGLAQLLSSTEPETLTEELQAELAKDRISDVSVLRYVLIPTADSYLQAVSEDKRTAIAHVLDEQITKHLREQLGLTKADFDCHILPIANLLQGHKVACFDMDSTLIEQEVIVELAKATGIGEKVNEITESAMRGEIDFSESFAKRLQLLHGTYADELADISETLTLSAGAVTTLKLLNALGYHTVLVSGGFTYFAKIIADKLVIDEYHANKLLIDEGKVMGDVVLPIVDGAKKAEIVEQIAKQQGVEMSEVICIGDGANDLPMMEKANLGFAYRAKPIVQAKADLAINCTGLDGVLYGLGYGAIVQ